MAQLHPKWLTRSSVLGHVESTMLLGVLVGALVNVLSVVPTLD